MNNLFVIICSIVTILLIMVFILILTLGPPVKDIPWVFLIPTIIGLGWYIFLAVALKEKAVHWGFLACIGMGLISIPFGISAIGAALIASIFILVVSFFAAVAISFISFLP